MHASLKRHAGIERCPRESGIGFLVKSSGFNASFLDLSGVAVAGGLLHWFFMPETRDQGQQEAERLIFFW
jgi:hypothetical protein